MPDAPNAELALLQPLIFLAAAVIAVPIFRRLRLGSVVGYLVAGIIIGPQVLGLFSDPASLSTLAELGIVLLLFIIGLELKPSRLWSMRRNIFGFGLAQVVLCGAVLGGIIALLGYAWPAAIIAGLGLALSSTAFATSLMQERGELTATYGQRAFSDLLLQDLAIVPLLALVAIVAPGAHGAEHGGLAQTIAAFVAVGIVVLVARYALNPLFTALAQSNAREIMTAAALLVVLGAATLMQLVGLSMAMGAFLAGVLLAESSFRHELEADIEPFRGLLLGLFFITVGMGIDLKLVSQHLALVGAAVVGLMLVKIILIYGLSRVTGSPHADALKIGGVLAQGGEFAFVLFGAAAAVRVMNANDANLLIAIVSLSLILTPLVFKLVTRLAEHKREAEEPPAADFSNARGRVIIIGFGRFGQVVAQFLLSQGVEVTAIEHNVEAIRAASRFGFRVYYGDGTRLDVLRAAGAADASLIALCVVKRDASARIVDLVQMHFPLAKIYVRAYDRRQALDLLRKNVDYQIRETYESAVAFGRTALEALGFSQDQAQAVEEEMRRRDSERLALQLAEGEMGGATLIQSQAVVPEPLIAPKHVAQPLNRETEEVTKSDGQAQADAQP